MFESLLSIGLGTKLSILKNDDVLEIFPSPFLWMGCVLEFVNLIKKTQPVS